MKFKVKGLEETKQLTTQDLAQNQAGIDDEGDLVINSGDGFVFICTDGDIVLSADDGYTANLSHILPRGTEVTVTF